MTNKGELRVWWIPQLGMENVFYESVETPKEAKKILDAFARYDLFQLENNVKPDFANAGGLEVFEDGEWCEWYDEESGESIDDVEFE